MKKLICLLSVLLALSGVMVLALTWDPGQEGEEVAEVEASVVRDRVPVSRTAQTKNAEIRRIIRQQSQE